MQKKVKFLLKLGAGLAVLGVVVLIAGTFLLKKKLPPEKVRGLLEENARKFLKREVRLNGVDLGLLSGLSVSGLEISETPDFKAGRFAKVDNFQLRVQLIPLLNKKIVVDRVVLEGLDLAVTKAVDGRFNFPDISGSTVHAKSAEKSPQAPALPFDLAVRQLRLSGARVSYRDAATGNELTLSEIEAMVMNFALDKPFDADISLKAAGRWEKRALSAGLEFSGGLNLAGMDQGRMSAEIRKAGLEIPQGKLELSGTITGATAPVVALKVSWKPAQAEALTMDVSGNLSSLDTQALDVSLQVAAKTPALKTDDYAVWGAPKGLSLPPSELAAQFHLRGESLSLKSMSLKTKGLDLKASGSVVRLRSAQPVPDLTVSAEIDSPALSSADLAFLKPTVKVPSDLKLPPLKASADVSVRGDDLQVKVLKVKTQGVSLEASGSLIAFRSSQPAHDFEAALTVSLPALKSADIALLGAFGIAVPPDLDLPPISLAARARLEADGLELRSLHFKTQGAALEASGTVKKIWSSRPDADVAASLKLDLPAIKAKDLAVLKLAKLDIPETLALPASKIDADAHFRGENLKIKALRLSAKGVLVTAEGSVRSVFKDPVPELSAKVSLDLPAFTSADVAFLPGVPADLNIPALSIEAELSGGMNSAEIKFMSLKTGANQLSLKGSLRNLKSGKPAYDLTMISKSFDLEEVTSLSAQTREMKLAGRGSFRLKVARKPPERPYFVGDLQFSGMGASVAGLKLSEFQGRGVFDERAINFDKISGKVDDGSLAMDLTVKNYAKTPSIDIQEISLDEFDLGKYLAARNALSGDQAPAESTAGQAPAVPPFNFRCRGFKIKKIKHSSFMASDALFKWDLYGVTPDFKSLDGEASILVSTGTIDSIDKLALQYPAAKVVMIPLMVIQNVAGLGIIKLLPDLKRVRFSRIDGDYAFSNGKMTLRRCIFDSSAALISSSGSIDLPTDGLDLDVNAKIGHYPGLNFTVAGTVEKPLVKLGFKKTAIEVIKDRVPLPEPLKKILDDPAAKLLDQFFKK